MRSPFPGIDPYLEHPIFWSSFHTRLMVAIADALAPGLRPRYYVDVETRTYQEHEDEEAEEEDVLVGIPDTAVLSTNVAQPLSEDLEEIRGGTLTQNRPQSITLPIPSMVKERYLTVRETGNDSVITVIEVLSPKNKQKGRGRTAYERKRSKILGSLSHLIEIDLLRGYVPMTMSGVMQPTDYRIMVSRAEQRPKADLYGFNLSESVPSFPLPLKPDDVEPIVDLQAIIMGVYERAGYGDRIDYRQPVPAPSLSPSQQQWVDSLLEPIRGGYGSSRQ
jgi:Protein of unknown function (DUF4058)